MIFTPKAQECITRLSSYIPFEEVKKVFKEFTGAQASQSTARRCTQETGEAILEEEKQKREQLQRKCLFHQKEQSVR
jgi:hypothetical protein